MPARRPEDDVVLKTRTGQVPARDEIDRLQQAQLRRVDRLLLQPAIPGLSTLGIVEYDRDAAWQARLRLGILDSWASMIRRPLVASDATPRSSGKLPSASRARRTHANCFRSSRRYSKASAS